MKSILLSILFAMLLFSFASCNFGEHGVFATLIRDEDVVASKFPDGVTIVGLAQIEITAPSDTTLPYAYASYGKISRFDGSDWTAQGLPSNDMRSLSIAARRKSLFVITSSDVSSGGGSLASALYVYEDRSGGEDTALWNPQWYLVKLPEQEAIYPIMDKIFVVNDRIFLVIRNTTDANTLVSSTRVLEITDWRKNPDEPADIINRSAEPLPPIRDANYAQGKIWFVSTGTLYSLGDTAGSTLSIETVRINTELVKGPFYGSGVVPTAEPDPELYIAAADAIYSYNKGLWQVVEELDGVPFVDVAHVESLSLTLIATHDEMKSARNSYAGKGLYQIDNAGTLTRPSEYDDLKNSDINTLLLLNNGNVLIGTSGGSVWEFNSDNSSIKRW